ncbi:hypothetical protein [Maledivibacter halophilus]|uniref:Phage tail tube protein n=1 Tax=Maledivibacter halophilus TaxID=36842 RepID=A0A1T5L8L8_9FIRM|nr:hypothetical protein [Maledivibacter halophilus]SKC68268.1 hypothetical protein SAMN02194393_02134 [Maledivibacter halophilus]SKC71738.1 hypothetical protein SAMN02194393_02518 [Maledivibacter halophilus]SKC80166.1 hypothetical protein SAMN02194393_03445 [Maledivibacter halophilus]
MKVNGKRYDWSDVDIHLTGLNIELLEISYDDELEKELQYGKGSKPKGYGTGNYKPTAKISLSREEFNILLAYCNKKKISLYMLEIPKIVVSYANDNYPTQTDVLPQVSITKTSNKAAQGDKSLKVDLDLLVSGVIVRNGVKAI